MENEPTGDRDANSYGGPAEMGHNTLRKQSMSMMSVGTLNQKQSMPSLSIRFPSANLMHYVHSAFNKPSTADTPPGERMPVGTSTQVVEEIVTTPRIGASQQDRDAVEELLTHRAERIVFFDSASLARPNGAIQVVVITDMALYHFKPGNCKQGHKKKVLLTNITRLLSASDNEVEMVVQTKQDENLHYFTSRREDIVKLLTQLLKELPNPVPLPVLQLKSNELDVAVRSSSKATISSTLSRWFRKGISTLNRDFGSEPKCVLSSSNVLMNSNAEDDGAENEKIKPIRPSLCNIVSPIQAPRFVNLSVSSSKSPLLSPSFYTLTIQWERMCKYVDETTKESLVSASANDHTFRSGLAADSVHYTSDMSTRSHLKRSNTREEINSDDDAENADVTEEQMDCHYCLRPCLDQITSIRRFSRAWHVGCFKCTNENCKKPLFSKESGPDGFSLFHSVRFYPRTGNLICSQACLRDFLATAPYRVSSKGTAKFCPGCTDLVDDMSSLEMGPAVVACGYTWHSKCLKCSSCQHVLDPKPAQASPESAADEQSPRDPWRVVEYKDFPYCAGCYEKKFQTCLGCNAKVKLSSDGGASGGGGHHHHGRSGSTLSTLSSHSTSTIGSNKSYRMRTKGSTASVSSSASSSHNGKSPRGKKDSKKSLINALSSTELKTGGQLSASFRMLPKRSKDRRFGTGGSSGSGSGGPRSLFAMGRFWHEGHFACHVCNVPFKRGKYYVEGEGLSARAFCRKHYYALFVPTCFTCGHSVRSPPPLRQILKAEDAASGNVSSTVEEYYSRKTPASPRGAGTRERGVTTNSYLSSSSSGRFEGSESTVNTTFTGLSHISTDSSRQCDRIRVINFNGVLFHPHKACFHCASCESPLLDDNGQLKPGYMINGEPLCVSCYQKPVSRACDKCGLAISSVGLVTELTTKYSMDEERQLFGERYNFWHPSCLTCADCRLSLLGGRVFVVYDFHDDGSSTLNPLGKSNSASFFERVSPILVCERDCIKRLSGHKTCMGCNQLLLDFFDFDGFNSSQLGGTQDTQLVLFQGKPWHRSCFQCQFQGCERPLVFDSCVPGDQGSDAPTWSKSMHRHLSVGDRSTQTTAISSESGGAIPKDLTSSSFQHTDGKLYCWQHTLKVTL